MKRILWVLAALIIPAFVLWGAGSATKRRSPYKYIGMIGGRKVSFDDFIKSGRDVQIALLLNYFSQPDVLKKLRTDRKFLNRLAWENLLIRTQIKKERITASNQEVIDFIMRHPLFSKDGVFSDRLYNYILKHSLGLTPRAFEESVRSFLTEVKFKRALVENVTVSDDEVRRLYEKEFERAKVNYIIIDKNDFKKNAEVSDDEITAYYEEEKGNFREAEKIILEYISFPHKEEGEKEEAIANLKTLYDRMKRRPRNFEKLAQDLIDKAKKQSEQFRQTISDEVGKIADKCRWVSRSDIDELKERIENLENRTPETPSQDSL